MSTKYKPILNLPIFLLFFKGLQIGFSWKNSSIYFFYFDLNPEGVTGRKTKTKIILKIIDGFRIKDWLLTCDEKIFYLYDLCFPCTTVPLESVLQPFTVVFVSE